MQTVHRVCPLCEATCGIAVELDAERVKTIRGDANDVFSAGYICPKAYGLKSLQDDPDRLRQPLRKTKAGFAPVGWQAALDEAIDCLLELREKHGADSIATYLGNPSAHSVHALIYGPVLQRALGTTQRYSASSVDQLPKMVSAGLMFGAGLTIPIPDIDRTAYLLMLGANPLASNGSLMTCPDFPGRLRKLHERGGKLVVIDPRRSETARVADEHHFIRPGSDALLLLAMVHALFEGRSVRLGRSDGLVRGLDDVERSIAPFSPERVAARVGIAAPEIRRLAAEFAGASSAACYGRIGTTCQEFGTLASWAVDLLNILSGNLDRPGGVMFTRPAANRGGNKAPDKRGGRGVKLGRRLSPVRRLPEMFGEFPAATLADEILREGDERVRGLLSIAGNPVLSTPNGERLDRALSQLDFMLSVDFYLNETTRHASLILPPPSPLERENYDLVFYQLSVRNIAKYSPRVLPRPTDQPDEWQILLTLAKGMMGLRDTALEQVDRQVLELLVAGELGNDGGQWPGLEAAAVLDALGSTPGPMRIIDLFLRTGPHGDGFGRRPEGLTLEKVRNAPHGIDLGPLSESLPAILETPDSKIDLYPELIAADLPRLEASLDRPAESLVLIGRRQLRSNNSWMHNLLPLVKGPERCLLLVHPDDAERLRLSDGAAATLSSRAGTIRAKIALSDEMMPGVVSLPHGWGHDKAGTQLAVASEHAGVNVNRVVDETFLDVPSANAALNGLPVTLAPA